MAEEHVILDAYGVRVTNQRFVAGPTTYAMTNITSVTTLERSPGYLGPMLILALGALAMLQALGMRFPGLGIGLLVAGAMWYRSRKAEHMWVVVVRTSAGEADAFRSAEKAPAMAVNEALNNAIIARG